MLLVFILCGCQGDTLPATEPTTAETEATAEVTEPVWTGYISSKDPYVYYYQDGRNLRWEEDLIYFANSHLSDNQLLRNRLFIVNQPGVKTDSANFYDAELHDAFLEEVNALIPEIEHLTDNEMLYRIQMLSALFRDVHTRSYGGAEGVYPIFFMPFWEEDTVAFHAVVLPSQDEKLLYAQLTAINDVPIGEIMERMRHYLSWENKYGFVSQLGYGGYGFESLSWTAALEATGISGIGDTCVKYTLMDNAGDTYDLNLETIDADMLQVDSLCGTWLPYALPIPYWYGDSENYWYTTDLAYSTLYVRIASFTVEEEETYMDFSNALTVESNTAGHFNKVILDLRGNGGGYQAEGWRAIISTLSRMDFDEFYVLVDAGTYSNSMIFAAEVAYLLPEVVFVGSPTGEAPGFFAGIYENDYIMPNCGMEFTVPTQYYQTFEANEENALIPDVVLWQSLEDYIACRDVVLEYVLSQ